MRLTRGRAISEDELASAKAEAKMDLLASWEDVGARTNSLGLSLLTLGRVVPLHEYFARIDAVSLDDITRVSNNTFYDRDHVLAAILPKIKGYYGQTMVTDYNQLRSKLNLQAPLPAPRTHSAPPAAVVRRRQGRPATHSAATAHAHGPVSAAHLTA